MARREEENEMVKEVREVPVVRLWILRWGIIFVFTVFIAVMKMIPGRVMDMVEFLGKARKLVLPIVWLRHYLLGSGEAREVSTETVLEAKAVFEVAITDGNNPSSWAPTLGNCWKLYRPYCVYHSTLYEGSGFHGRPTLFYLLGGFTFRLYPGKVERELVVSGNDHYDWHADELGRYFSSPIGTGKVAHAVIWLAGLLFGREYFLGEGSPYSVTGEMGVSNRLWADMKLTGAAEFDSYFENISLGIYSEEELACLEDPSREDKEEEEEVVETAAVIASPRKRIRRHKSPYFKKLKSFKKKVRRAAKRR